MGTMKRSIASGSAPRSRLLALIVAASCLAGGPSGCHMGLEQGAITSGDEGEAGGGTDDPGSPVTWYRDSDGDGYGDASQTTQAPTQPNGYVLDSSDCDDGDASVHPDADEYCDGIDNDCDGVPDDNPVDGGTYYLDADGDSFGDPSSVSQACELPDGHALNDLDCNDADITEPVVADPVGGSELADQCVLALPGTFRGTIDLAGKSLLIEGRDGSAATVIDAQLPPCGVMDPEACQPVITIASNSNASPVIRGFTITGGTGAYSRTKMEDFCADSSISHGGQNTCTIFVYEYCGGGIYVEGDDPTLEDLRIEENVLPEYGQQAFGDFSQLWTYSYGGGLCVRGGVADLDGVRFDRNEADLGGAIFGSDSAALTMQHAVLWQNIATDGGAIYLEGASLTSNNSIVACNQASTDGGGLFNTDVASSVLVNTIFYGNGCSVSGEARGSQIYQSGGATLDLTNSILQASSSAYVAYGTGAAVFRYDDVYNSSDANLTYGGNFSAGNNDMSEDPRFSDAHCSTSDVPNFGLRSTSPAIDAGDPDAVYDDVDGSRNDLGAYGGPGGSW